MEEAKIKITMDGKGLSYWKDDVPLLYKKDKDDKGEFFDSKCDIRGTDSQFDLLDMLIGDQLEDHLKDGQYIEVSCKIGDIKTYNENIIREIQ
jgi:hypothetical protein